MSCDDIAVAIVDEELPRPLGYEAHLEQCSKCCALARLHASATRLRLPGPAPLSPIPAQSILGEVNRRQQRRRAVAGAAVVGAVATLALIVMPRPVERMPAVSAPLRGEPASIHLLFEEVQSYTRGDPSVRDGTYAPFGALALWVRPPDTVALEDRPFRTAIAPLHPSPTQEPAR